ncbi:M48 family metalloprotease [Uliginosibacterium sp. H3]|uniref:M48 family metalloprotease n=1 Tax=Uliginosibacterium silvisoli TaxID=3114758 RepID=A0ABU6K9S6_9RHOO|nr:M48 family metalloprotease [Uliginosibacterium sp. H3]
MTEQEFKRLIARLELDADATPDAYRMRTVALAALGYLYVFGLLAVSLGGVALGLSMVTSHHTLVGGKVMFIFGALSVLVVRALWVRFDRPQGLRLSAEQAPKLFELVEKVRQKCGGPKLHEVLLVDELNAAICQTPRLGLFGWYRNSLIIGLPMMQALSVSQFSAVLAHEFGHLVGAHGKMGAWVYRLRATWARILQSFDERDSVIDAAARAFLRWYIPYFQAYSFVLARQQEFDADRISAKVAGAHNAADALVAVNLQARFLHESYWPKVWGAADHAAQPPLMPFSGMSTAIKLGAEGTQAADWLAEALRERTDTHDTHPCLRERLEAFDHKAQLPAALKASAAQTLLQGCLQDLIKRLDKDWWLASRERWSERHNEVQGARASIAELGEQEPRGMSAANLMRLGMAYRTLGDKSNALQVLHLAADAHGGTAEAAYFTGCLMLEADDARGIHYLELAMTRDGEAIEPANWRALEYYERIGDEGQANVYRERLQALA